ncbi:unnamed protein product [Psylliodes chrysocephalus]|uniref:DUF7869 domain-containing protein n=1 Tax=Psylliodes chrysocephalus TaxID=3402493 RepID=A0A9P0DEA2_9CUCU|nr:unnamed protein product [Psylliodes chrysocephala]
MMSSGISKNASRKRRASGTGGYRQENKTLKWQGKQYRTYTNKLVPAKPKREREFYETDSAKQGTYLMGLINIGNIKRIAESSRRQCSIFYTVSDGSGNLVLVCKGTFLNIFAITSKKIEILVKKKMSETDKRKGNSQSKFTENDRQLVRYHIMSIPRDVSHYSRQKSEKEYLSPDLNIHRLHRAFLEKFPDSRVTYKYYRLVFLKDFPNLSFYCPRVDTCRTCDKLNCEVQAQISSSKTAKTQLELHHRKVEKSLAALKEDTVVSQKPESILSCITMDQQQVLFVPTLTHLDMFYHSQLSCYNFGIHLSDSNSAFMCMWNESIGGRGGNEIASCLLRVLNMGITDKRHITIWCDNCAGQNKNRMVLFVRIFLVSTGVFESIEQKFFVSGYSIMACDRDFALIEKRKRTLKSFVTNDLHDVVRSSKYSRPFSVVNMEELGFFDIQAAATVLSTPKALTSARQFM